MHSLSMKQCFTNKANSNRLRDTPEQEHPEEFEMLGAVTYFSRIRISLSIPHFPPPIIFESPLSLSHLAVYSLKSPLTLLKLNSRHVCACGPQLPLME